MLTGNVTGVSWSCIFRQVWHSQECPVSCRSSCNPQTEWRRKLIGMLNICLMMKGVEHLSGRMSWVGMMELSIKYSFRKQDVQIKIKSVLYSPDMSGTIQIHMQNHGKSFATFSACYRIGETINMNWFCCAWENCDRTICVAERTKPFWMETFLFEFFSPDNKAFWLFVPHLEINYPRFTKWTTCVNSGF